VRNGLRRQLEALSIQLASYRAHIILRRPAHIAAIPDAVANSNHILEDS